MDGAGAVSWRGDSINRLRDGTFLIVVGSGGTGAGEEGRPSKGGATRVEFRTLSESCFVDELA